MQRIHALPSDPIFQRKRESPVVVESWTVRTCRLFDGKSAPNCGRVAEDTVHHVAISL